MRRVERRKNVLRMAKQKEKLENLRNEIRRIDFELEENRRKQNQLVTFLFASRRKQNENQFRPNSSFNEQIDEILRRIDNLNDFLTDSTSFPPNFSEQIDDRRENFIQKLKNLRARNWNRETNSFSAVPLIDFYFCCFENFRSTNLKKTPKKWRRKKKREDKTNCTHE